MQGIREKRGRASGPLPRAKKRRARARRLAPGQRLICYALAALGLVLVQGYFLPLDKGQATKAEHVVSVPIQEPFALSEKLENLNAQISSESAKPKLHAGVFMVQPATGKYVDLDGHMSYPAASMIKIPVFVNLLVAMEKQGLSPKQELVIRPDLIAGGSGFLQWRPVGSKVSLGEAAELMITHSDNTATNLVIDALGGISAVNKEFASWGLAQTKIYNMLPDFEGTNRTSPYDLVYLLGKVDQGSLLDEPGRKLMYRTMEHCHTRTLLPQGLGPGAKIAHKTGDIGLMVGDAGIVTAPDGMRYIVAVQVERPHNDRRANKLVRDISGMIYKEFTGWSPPPPKPKPVRHRKRRY